MAAKLESAVTIARPVEEVYRFLLDLDKHPTDPGVESVIKTPDGPTRARNDIPIPSQRKAPGDDDAGSPHSRPTAEFTSGGTSGH